jgi:hypothetical protein
MCGGGGGRGGHPQNGNFVGQISKIINYLIINFFE